MGGALQTLTSSKGKRSWKMRLILAPPDNSTVLISLPDPAMLRSKSPPNVVIILKDADVTICCDSPEQLWNKLSLTASWLSSCA